MVVIRGDHQGLNLGNGQQGRVEVSMVAVKMERDESHHWSSGAGER